MADKILIKRSLTSGSVPSTSSLLPGELAINVADAKVFLKQSGSSAEAIRSLLTLDTINTGSVLLTGSISVTEEIKSNEFQLNAGTVSLVFTGSINQGVFGVSEYIQPYISTLQYSGMTVEYLAQRPGACRMGIIMASWLDTGSVTFTDISTTDIGDTSDISFRFISSSNELRLRVNSAGSGSGTWTVQSLFKLFPNLNS